MSSDEQKASHMIVVGICRLGECLFLEVEMSTTGSLPVMKRGECCADPAVRPLVECSIGVSPGQEGIVLRIKRQTGSLESAEVDSHRLSGPSEKYKVRA